jgi:NifU-like protein
MASVYPDRIFERLRSPRNVGPVIRVDATGKSASLECGTYVLFELSIEAETKCIEKISYKSNGCGFMIAAADVLAGEFDGRRLTELNALTDEPQQLTLDALGKFPSARLHCANAVFEALRDAFADFRRRRIEEFAGEKALICTCFGVTEEVIENVINKHLATTVDEVGRICNAGTGCGSCQMMIQEMIELNRVGG